MDLTPHPGERSALLRYGTAAVSVVLAVLVRMALDPYLQDQQPYPTFFLAVTIVSWYAGEGPALASALLGFLAAGWFFVPPRGQVEIGTVSHVVRLATSWSVTIIAVARAMHRARAQAMARQADLEREIDERKRSEEALLQSERMYRAIGKSIDYGVWVCAPDGRNTYASESFLKLVGLTQEQCSDFGWGGVLHPDDAERTVAAWKECVRTEGTWDIEHRYRGVDGKWHPILARGVPVRDERGKLRLLGWHQPGHCGPKARGAVGARQRGPAAVCLGYRPHRRVGTQPGGPHCCPVPRTRPHLRLPGTAAAVDPGDLPQSRISRETARWCRIGSSAPSRRKATGTSSAASSGWMDGCAGFGPPGGTGRMFQAHCAVWRGLCRTSRIANWRSRGSRSL